MLRELYIENLATIEKASISFGDKLNVFTGETGAGKSILIGGINAILGQRVYKDIVRAGTNKAVITAFFDNVPLETEEKLSQLGYELEEGQLILQREISSDGRSVARICGKPTTISALREIGTTLIDIHGQHDNQILMSTDNQRDILDSYGNIQDDLEIYRKNFKDFSQITRKIKKMQLSEAEKAETLDMLNYQIDEIKSLNLIPNEDEILERKLATIRNSAQIQNALRSALVAIDGEDDFVGSMGNLERALDEISSLEEVLPTTEEVYLRLDSLIIDLDDIRQEIAFLSGDSWDDSDQLNQMEERISDINRLKRKYGMSVDELLQHLYTCNEEISNLDEMDSIIDDLLASKKVIGEGVKLQAENITKLRKEAAEKLSQEISKQLVFLDMPNIKLMFHISQDKVTINGMDHVEMLISVNKGEEPKPINKVASGGELSRIMLAIKNVLADNDSIPTMVFDEIDTGISGRAAQKVGIKLSETGKKRQVLCVTHLAQIAAVADNHLLIQKTSDDKRTYTNVQTLDFEGRKKEIARIIAGDEESENSLKTAEEMMLSSLS